MRDLLRRIVARHERGERANDGPITPAPSSVPGAARASVLESDADFVDAAYWLVLGRPADELRRAELARLLEHGQSRTGILLSLVGPTEFRLRYGDLLARETAPDRDDALERGLRTLGADGAFVEACYACLLGREADAGGRAAYLALLDGGAPRHAVAYALLRSREFADRYRELCPAGGVIPRDVQLCELANPAKWDNPEWMAVLDELQLPAAPKLAMHRKAYEFTQMVWGLRRLGALTDRAAIVSVGAGHESLVYWLANQAGRVVATDLYQGEWRSAGAAEGDIRVLTHPEEFAPFPYRRDRLRFLQMDGRFLAFRDGTFDVAYSLSSIEHFGGWRGARQAVEEMARVLKPGGVLVLATEWCVSGPPRDEVFQPAEIRALIDVPGVEPVEPLDDRVWTRYAGAAVDLRRNPYETPHMLVQIDGTVFTSVVLFLRKR
jgi:SAM-dependent methyltransferase